MLERGGEKGRKGGEMYGEEGVLEIVLVCVYLSVFLCLYLCVERNALRGVLFECVCECVCECGCIQVCYAMVCYDLHHISSHPISPFVRKHHCIMRHRHSTLRNRVLMLRSTLPHHQRRTHVQLAHPAVRTEQRGSLFFRSTQTSPVFFPVQFLVQCFRF